MLDSLSDAVCARLMLYRDPVHLLVAAAKHLRGRDEKETGKCSPARGLLLTTAADLVVERWKEKNLAVRGGKTFEITVSTGAPAGACGCVAGSCSIHPKGGGLVHPDWREGR